MEGDHCRGNFSNQNEVLTSGLYSVPSESFDIHFNPSYNNQYQLRKDGNIDISLGKTSRDSKEIDLKEVKRYIFILCLFMVISMTVTVVAFVLAVFGVHQGRVNSLVFEMGASGVDGRIDDLKNSVTNLQSKQKMLPGINNLPTYYDIVLFFNLGNACNGYVNIIKLSVIRMNHILLGVGSSPTMYAGITTHDIETFSFQGRTTQ